VGGTRVLVIPAALGYGSRGAGCRGGECIIDPGASLTFTVELKGFK
jgi:peptidylprolyl isomerase